MDALDIQSISVRLGERMLLRDFSLCVPAGEIHVLMGPNGEGKSSLAKALVGHPDYVIDSGKVRLDGTEIQGKLPDEIARLGLFLGFQAPMELPGVSVLQLLRSALQARLPEGKLLDHAAFYRDLYAAMTTLKIDRSWANRGVNEGFSGGEKKRCEMLQMLMLKPRYVILDEIDSGLDVDAIQLVGRAIQEASMQGAGILLITHYQKLLEQLQPKAIHILSGGKIVRSGGMDLARELDESGFEKILTKK